MSDICVMCGRPVPEGTQVCSICQYPSNSLSCQECASTLRQMHSSQAATGDSLIVSRLFHCDACHRDWEHEATYVLQSTKVKRKFWG